ncbi:deoxynucleoside kinase [Alkalilimnicola sp. S0819]|uniref:deoxynucleoside kinase n=1 Tax=Alkalilimnicola sp. S0819 TaxID=2613922 RepID=UPI0012623247|nr:deoxynucleoside kinase [Alkalilimnicola sp. S0819]KAB7628342.1 deoxynucleoside kinase [Alkalilimnicola sp. S0819]MPQ15243.1 AAA family ATPase [Alkalilimnicola sp. S0819]
MNTTKPRYIVVEGPIGVGKTSLARRLAESFGSELLLERAEDNPFLERFYQQPRDAAFPTQLFFLMQRAEQQRALRQGDMFRPALVSDYLFDKDRLFARLNLREAEFNLYDKVYRELALDAPAPDLVIYLQAPVEVLVERIQRRGIAYEQQMAQPYLQGLSESYVQFFYHYEQAPLLIVNTRDINPVDNDREYALLLEQIRSVRSGRHYFNPAPMALA